MLPFSRYTRARPNSAASEVTFPAIRTQRTQHPRANVTACLPRDADMVEQIGRAHV